MRKISSRVLFAVAAFATGGLGNAFAASMEAMQGAWTMDGTDCAETFEKVDGNIRFQDRGGSTSTGIIVSGSKISAPNAICTAERVNQEENRLTVRLSCADSIMFGSMSVSFRLIDAEHFERFDQLFPEESTKYHKCSL